MSKREYGLARYWKRLELIRLCCRLSLPLILSMAPSPIKWRPRQIWWLERLWRAGGGENPAGPACPGGVGRGAVSALLGAPGRQVRVPPPPPTVRPGPLLSLLPSS